MQAPDSGRAHASHELPAICSQSGHQAGPLKLTERTSARETGVCICVHKKLHLEQVSDLLGVEGQDPFEEHHIRRVDGDRLLFPAKQSMMGLNGLGARATARIGASAGLGFSVFFPATDLQKERDLAPSPRGLWPPPHRQEGVRMATTSSSELLP